jgi:hypothetical protein
MRIINFCFYFLLILITSCKSTEKGNTQNKSASAEVPFTVLSEGSNGGFDKDTLILIRSNDEMNENWRKLFSNFVELPDMPAVNFSNQMVVILNMGEKNNGGYNISVTSVVEKELQLAVYADYISPGPNCLVAEVISYPFTVIAIPQKDKLVAVSKKAVVSECK